jgi:glyoxalase family protein
MRLDGIHHITCITADAPQNVEFYAGTLGLRMVKKSVNQDDPTVYHLFYADEKGSAGSDITFFEYPGAPLGRAGAGMIHRITWRVASAEALDFWEKRLEGAGVATSPSEGALRFKDPEGLELEFRVVETDDEPLTADHPHVPREFALQGFHSARAFSADPDESSALLEQTLGFEAKGDNEWEIRGDNRHNFYSYDEAPGRPGLGGAGTVHHIAWASTMDEHADWRQRVAEANMNVTPIIDRFWFRSIYFREPSGVLFEIATLGPGFDVDEPAETLGQKLVLPPDFEHLRDKIEKIVKPLPNPRAEARA